MAHVDVHFIPDNKGNVPGPDSRAKTWSIINQFCEHGQNTWRYDWAAVREGLHQSPPGDKSASGPSDHCTIEFKDTNMWMRESHVTAHIVVTNRQVDFRKTEVFPEESDSTWKRPDVYDTQQQQALREAMRQHHGVNKMPPKLTQTEASKPASSTNKTPAPVLGIGNAVITSLTSSLTKQHK